MRHSLVDELSYLTQELTSSLSDEGRKPTLLEDIETLHRNLKELQSLKSYVQVVEHSLRLNEAALQQIRDLKAAEAVTANSVTHYRTLQEFVETVSQSCSTVEDGAGQKTLHLVQFLGKVRDRAWQAIRDLLSDKLLVAAEGLQWPRPVDYSPASSEIRGAFEHAFLNLVRLQDIGESLRPFDSQLGPEKRGLYPLQALVQPVSLRFKYHFEGKRQTNRLDKPEWYFTHVANVAHEHRSFMDSVVQSLLNSTKYKTISAWDEFAFLLLPLLARKLRRTMPTLLPHPSLLAHTIYQSLSFDAALVEEGFQISRTSAALNEPSLTKWEGVSEVILGKKEWFEAWLDGEKRFAEEQYHETISSSDAWLIADDAGDEERGNARNFKTTNSARRVKALVEQITDRYSPLPDFTQKTRFLISVQLPILEHYQGRIASSLDAFESLSSAFVRAVPGALGVTLGTRDGDSGVKVDTRGLTAGVEGAQRLCKALLSAKYIELSMEDWGEELFFLELWTEISHRASLRQWANANPNLPHPDVLEAETPQDTIFQELVDQYRKLMDRTETMLVQQICGEIEGDLKAHFTSVMSHKHEHTDDIALSQTLLAPVALLSSHIAYLAATLPLTNATAIYRRVAGRLAEYIHHRGILYRGQFAAHEGRAICAESELWLETCHVALRAAWAGLGGGRARIEAPWAGLVQASRLVALEGDAWDRVVEATFGTADEEEWRKVMADLTGFSQLSREDVAQVLKCRDDCLA
ncbi:hypothetical protein HGRIS_007501 [Hohenbuehelia grisea]|uniref:RINT1-like protein n=1 Tax=Hohenbuehelia grisea TaxID=104357 RepID=A0ABR3J6F7_9AGAR